ncbi:hypothetical protein SAY86_024223 [Trapa natans]|uniref:non-specific serine/threonine protein kinase n=1 Tax=Trapa natans TaxID=22666 RepID=A0AAN7RJE7_TRANT|nr:hypothetical protein SAY86_024223 [Trapa natans]
MAITSELKQGFSSQFSTGSLQRGISRQYTTLQASLDPRISNPRFSFGRQSSLDPNTRCPDRDDNLKVPKNLDSTMQLLFMACRGDVRGVQKLLDEGVDVNSIDLDGRTALHIAACEGHVGVVKLLLTRKVNIDARDRWGSTPAADAHHYGNMEVHNILRDGGAKVPERKRAPRSAEKPREVPEYELNPLEIQVRKSDGILRGNYQVAKWNGTKVSVKILDKESYSDPESLKAFKYELEMLVKARHPNLVQFIGAVTQKIPMMIVAEYHPKGDLGTYIKKKGRLFPSKALRFALDIARGINYFHECKPDPIIHCDLKPRNILLDGGGQLKVSGFGLIQLSKVSSDKVRLAQPEAHSGLQSLYVAPEVFKNGVFDRSADAFSFGLILYEMFEGVQPFHPKSPEEAARMICLEGRRPPFKVKSKGYPPELRELIVECWDEKPMMRPTSSEIIVRLNKIVANCSKQGWWKASFRLRYVCSFGNLPYYRESHF